MTKERRRRRQKCQAERRKRKRWSRALAGLNDSVILLLEAGQMDRVPIGLLSLPKLKARIRDYNLALALARTDAPDERSDADYSPASAIDLLRPKLMKSTAPIDLTTLEAVHVQGRRAYVWLASRGELVPAPDRHWALIYHADMVAALPSINLKWKRRRDRYLVGLIRDERGRIKKICAYSTTWCPLFERRITWTAPYAGSFQINLPNDQPL